MTKAELHEVRELRKRIKETEQKIEIIRARQTNLVPLMDGMPRAKNARSKVEDLTVKVMELQSELEDLHEKYLDAQAALADKIMTDLDEPNLQTVLIFRYVECLTYREIARRMNFTVRHVFDIHSKFFRLHIDGTK